jgi:hypothetical protein
MERCYRNLYDELRDKSDEELRQLNSKQRLYSMDWNEFTNIKSEPLLKVGLRPTIACFHGLLVASVFAVILLLH